jgi:hypothetical protein
MEKHQDARHGQTPPEGNDVAETAVSLPSGDVVIGVGNLDLAVSVVCPD